MHQLFEILFVVGNPGKISNGKSILQGSLHLENERLSKAEI